jgi:hypothetical protein
VHRGEEKSYRLLPEAGSPGRALALTIICLFASVLLVAAYFTWSESSTNAQLVSTNRSLAVTNVKLREEQSAAQKAGLLIEKAICTDMGTMARIPPPEGSAAANPSRAYEQDEHRAWEGLFDGLGCRKT